MFGFLPNNLYTGHRAANTSGLSPRLWGRVSGSMMASDGNKRLVLVGDDFSAIHTAGTLTDLISEHPYLICADDTSNHSVVGAADEKGGVLQLKIDAAAAANEEIGIELGDGTGQLGQISDTAGDAHLTAFECCLKVSTITDGKLAMLAGLVGPGSVDGDTLTDTSGIPTAANHGIGFNIKADDGNAIDFFYEAAGQTRVDVIEGIEVPAADTLVKLGFIYDPDAIPAKRITVYVNNIEQGTYVTATQIAAATFPDAEALTFAFAMKGIAGSTALEAGIDWWAFAQLI